MGILIQRRRQAKNLAEFLSIATVLVLLMGCSSLPAGGEANSESEANLSGTQEVTITSITYTDPLQRDDLIVYFKLGDKSYNNPVHESWNATLSDMEFVDTIHKPAKEEWESIELTDTLYQLTLLKTSFYTLEVSYDGDVYLIDIGPGMSYQAIFDGNSP